MTAAEAKLSAKAKETLEFFTLTAARADAAWLPAVPAPLFERARRSRDGGKLLSRWVSSNLQLSMPRELALAEHERWLLQPRAFYLDAALELGTLLSSGWIRTKVSRQSVTQLQHALGEPLYANSLVMRHSPLNDTLVSLLDRAGSAESLRDTVRAVGAHAMLSTLATDERKLTVRARSVYAKRWLEYDAVMSVVMDTDAAFVQSWLASRCDVDETRADASVQMAGGDSQ